jgi:hypothetical protein
VPQHLKTPENRLGRDKSLCKLSQYHFDLIGKLNRHGIFGPFRTQKKTSTKIHGIQ